MTLMTRRRVPIIALLAGLAACATGATATATSRPMEPAAVRPAMESAPPSIRWYRTSAEMRALYLQTYRAATATIERRAAGLPAGSWAVILDADETLIDNSPYELQQARLGVPYDSVTWDAWVKRGAAAALPGGVEFTSKVHALGGRVVVVTNRDAGYCDATRANILRVGIPADEVLCRTDRASGSKDPRFIAVQNGTAPSTLPPLRVLMWVGDNIQDFPALTQSAMRSAPASAFDEFGERFVVLPNPMYGSWEGNPLP
jgi:5'-nucleotidase (lipoprotein e(P4) family)